MSEGDADRVAGGVFRLGFGTQGAQLRCGLSRSGQGWREQRFLTPQYALVYVVEGQGLYVDAGGTRFAFGPGDLFQRFPSVPHSVQYQTPCFRCYVAVPCQVCEVLELVGLVSRQNPVLAVGSDAALVRAFEELAQRLRACPERALAQVLLPMQALVVELLERGRPAAARDAPGDPIRLAMQILSAELASRCPLTAVAARVGLSYSAFRKRFVQVAGIPPGDFRIRRRIERAMALITGEGLAFKEVARRLGYSDVYAFSAQFKSVTGVTPKAFRAQCG